MKVWLSWSSGKDSAWVLHRLRHEPNVEIVGLLTTINETFERVAMHGVRRDLVERQAVQTGIPLVQIPLPWPCSNRQYEKRMQAACDRARKDGVEGIAFGDLYLEDVRSYREKQLQGTGLEPIFPIWGLDTSQLALEMIDAGLEAYLTCVDPKILDRSFAGRSFDRSLLTDLPSGVDPCGEGGEFHTCVVAGPVFDSPIGVRRGETVERDGFVYTDLIPEPD